MILKKKWLSSKSERWCCPTWHRKIFTEKVLREGIDLLVRPSRAQGTFLLAHSIQFNS
ncbi:hypothetical protein Syun_015878 [Stephania yunnanensis]|uniref:Uncharacterized protein n=1 Tax=Stephania yunnanensis TaxID=152371 RepID=A0AAP0J6I0_9MAGN